MYGAGASLAGAAVVRRLLMLGLLQVQSSDPNFNMFKTLVHSLCPAIYGKYVQMGLWR